MWIQRPAHCLLTICHHVHKLEYPARKVFRESFSWNLITSSISDRLSPTTCIILNTTTLQVNADIMLN